MVVLGCYGPVCTSLQGLILSDGRCSLKDRSLIMGRGLQNGRGAVNSYPTKKKGGGGRTSLSHAKGVGTNCFALVLT